MTLAILRWLTTGYGKDATITRLVNTREIWIVFGMNPDGATYDIGGRRLAPLAEEPPADAGSSSIGTDLNRNYDYRWGCCGGSSSTPSKLAVPRPDLVLGARDARAARLRDQPRRRRPPADPGRDQLPHDRPPRDVAVRPHADRRADRYGGQGPQGVRGDGQGDGRVERLHAAAGERPVHLVGHVARLAVRSLPDLLVHVRDVTEHVGLSARTSRFRTRPAATATPCST